MLRIRSLLALVCLAGSASACDEAPDPTGPTPATPEALVVTVPMLTAGALITTNFNVLEPPPPSPAESDIPLIDELDIDEVARPLQQIIDPDTRVGFEEGFAWSFGVHHYIGNIGRVETTAHVDDRGQEIGSSSAHRQDYTPFLLDFGRVKIIGAQAKVFSEQTCGLSVQGDSRHFAWWQFFQGGSAPLWGSAQRTTQEQPARQAACERQTSGGTLSQEGPAGTVCFYYITYDVDTLEILSMDFLYCAAAGGEFL